MRAILREELAQEHIRPAQEPIQPDPARPRTPSTAELQQRDVVAVALAGLVMDQPVVVTLNADGSGNSNGNMVTARFSKNDVEFIGCGVRRIDNGAGGVVLFAFCQAADAANVQGFCTTDNPNLIASIGDNDDFSFITFAWNAAGECRSIGNSTQSFYIPKK